jgi:hypothetical protein
MQWWLAFRQTCCVVFGRVECFVRTITGIPCSAHITMLLAELHWLRAAERIKFKLGKLTYRCLHCTAPCYLSAQLTIGADIPSRRRLRSSTTDALLINPTRLVTVNFPATSPLPNLWRLSVVSLKLFFFIISGFIICTARHLCNCSLYININLSAVPSQCK